MKTLSIFTIMTAGLILIACSTGQTDTNAQIERKIFQRIDVDGMGMLKDIKIVSIDQEDDSTYQATHTFTNPLFDREMRITSTYYFTSDKDSIKNTVTVKT